MQIRMDVGAVWGSSGQTQMVARRLLNLTRPDEFKTKSLAEVGPVTILREVPFWIRSTSCSSRLPPLPTCSDLGSRLLFSSHDFFTCNQSLLSPANAIVGSPSDVRTHDVAFEPDRPENPHEVVVAFSETVLVQDLPSSKEDQDVRASPMSTIPKWKAQTDARALAKREGKQPEGGSKKSRVPTPVSLGTQD